MNAHLGRSQDEACLVAERNNGQPIVILQDLHHRLDGMFHNIQYGQSIVDYVARCILVRCDRLHRAGHVDDAADVHGQPIGNPDFTGTAAGNRRCFARVAAVRALYVCQELGAIDGYYSIHTAWRPGLVATELHSQLRRSGRIRRGRDATRQGFGAVVIERGMDGRKLRNCRQNLGMDGRRVVARVDMDHATLKIRRDVFLQFVKGDQSTFKRRFIRIRRSGHETRCRLVRRRHRSQVVNFSGHGVHAPALRTAHEDIVRSVEQYVPLDFS